ncbi:MAG: DNA polymerase IV, partial [Dehalococcoidia bacterium]
MVFGPYRAILHVDLDAFFVAVEQAREPRLRGKAVVVGGRKGQRGVVATASYEARRYGVHSAMPLAVAERLCPQAIFLPGNFQIYQEASEAFFAILGRYTPLVEAASLDEAYLDVTGCEPIAGSPQEAAAAIQRQVGEELGLSCSVGVATAKVVAKVASDAAKPGGVKVVPRGKEAAFLGPLPVRVLPMVGPKVEATLVEMGARTIGDMARLPQAWFTGRFGAMGSVLWLRANGIDASPVQGQRAPAKSVGRE